MVRTNNYLNFTCWAKQETERTDSSLPTIKTEFMSAIHFPTGRKTHTAYVIKWDWVSNKTCQFITLSPCLCLKLEFLCPAGLLKAAAALSKSWLPLQHQLRLEIPGEGKLSFTFLLKQQWGWRTWSKLKTVLFPQRMSAKQSRHTIHYLSQRFIYLTKRCKYMNNIAVGCALCLLIGQMCWQAQCICS